MIGGLGTDIVETSRIREMLERHGAHFVERCFTPGEIEYASKHRDPTLRYAGRWAAKEAVVKVLGTAEMKEQLAKLGAEPVGGSPQQFGAFVQAESRRWGKIIKDLGIKPE